jgi:hypothetical protein
MEAYGMHIEYCWFGSAYGKDRIGKNDGFGGGNGKRRWKEVSFPLADRRFRKV